MLTKTKTRTDDVVDFLVNVPEDDLTALLLDIALHDFESLQLLKKAVAKVEAGYLDSETYA